MTIGQRLEQVRASLGLTQAEMCVKMGLPLRTYTRYALGQRPPSAEALAALVRMGININWLLTGDGAMRLSGGPIEPACPPPIDEALGAAVFEGVMSVYLACGARMTGHAGRVVARIYTEIVEAGLGTWEEKMAALQFALVQVRRRLHASNHDDGDHGKQSA